MSYLIWYLLSEKQDISCLIRIAHLVWHPWRRWPYSLSVFHFYCGAAKAKSWGPDDCLMTMKQCRRWWRTGRGHQCHPERCSWQGWHDHGSGRGTWLVEGPFLQDPRDSSAASLERLARWRLRAPQEGRSPGHSKVASTRFRCQGSVGYEMLLDP